MNIQSPRLALLLLGVATITSSSLALDWPQWQGPDRNAMSKETGLLKEWPSAGPRLAWRTNGLGGGYSEPSIAAGRIFGTSTRGEDNVVWALSEANGKELWVTSLGPTTRQQMPQGQEGPGSTPTVDGDRLYVVSMAGQVACVQVSDGKVVWQKSFRRDFGGAVPTWSFRESPLIDGNKVILTPGGPNATLVALDKMTGEPIWKSQVPGNPEAAYSSVIAIDFEGQRQYVQFTARGMVGVAAVDGKFLWQYTRVTNPWGINVTTPLFHDGQLLVSEGYGSGSGLVKLSKAGNDGVNAEEVWNSRRLQNHHGGMILLDGALYGANGGNSGGTLVCLDFKTGDVLWDGQTNAPRRLPKGSLAFADGQLYYRDENGPMFLIEPNPSRYIERGSFVQPDRSRQPAWTHPVIANGKLYLRDQDILFCYDVKLPNGPRP